jgi:hypothetical protein
MWFWPVNQMIEHVLCLFFYILRNPNMASGTPGGARTPDWIPLV